MKKILTILLIFFTLGLKAQTVDTVHIKLAKVDLSTYLLKTDTTNKWVNTIANNATLDSLIYFVGSTRYAIPVPKDTTNLQSPNYYDSTTKTQYLGYNGGSTRITGISNDTTSTKDSLKIITGFAAKTFAISKRYADTSTASKTFVKDVTVKRLLRENVHTYIDPAIPTATNATSHLTIPTYDGSGQTVHPDVYYNPNGWMGHKWWMAITPYYQQRQRFENPSLLCSDDGKTWVVPAGVTNPISPEPTDTLNTLQYDPEIIPPGYDNKLRVMYGRGTNGVFSAFYTRSFDGTTIGPEVLAFPDSAQYVVSPCVIEKNGTYIMYYVDIHTYASPVLKKRTATNPEGPWSPEVLCTVNNNTTYDIWHVNATLIGDQIALLITTTTHGSSGGNAKLFFASSTNDSTFTTGSIPVLNKHPGYWDNNEIYRSSAIILDGGTKRLGLYYSASDSLNNWFTGYTEVSLISSTPSTWGNIGGSLSSQTDLQTALNGKQSTITSPTAGDVLFGSGSTAIVNTDANIFWDNINKRLGVGTNTPAVTFELRANDALTNVGQTVFALNHRTSGTAAVGFGIGMVYSLQSSTTYDRAAAQTAVNWVDAADATRRASLIDYLYNTSGSNKLAISRVLQSDQNTVFNGANTSTPNSTFQVAGSFSTAYLSKASSYTATATDNTIEVTATGQTITLPTAVGIAGREYIVKLTAAGTATIATTSSQTIDGSTTYSLSAQYKYVKVQSNGANWIIIGGN